MPHSEELQYSEVASEADADEFVRLKERYLDRLADIAELGRAIGSRDKRLRLLTVQHADLSLRTYILSQLQVPHARMQQMLAQKHRILARRRLKKRLTAEMDLVAGSGLFDAAWYLANNPDLAKSGVDPLFHFVMDGAYELRDPGPKFSAFRYHKAYPDVTGVAVPALIHYLRNGKAEGRTAVPVSE
ncbi:hypothetical protein IT881_06550 [Erythrobacter sp. A30-3]|nr:hypothetical protein IT881_06550 [Erythrobacter sp. A30-3]